jgi:hypothetical protein
MDLTTSDIPKEVSNILIDLTVIQRIPTNHKLNVNSKTYANVNSKYESFWRWKYDETGDKTIDHINKTIDKAIEVSKKYPAWVNTIADNVSAISNSLLGLERVYERDNKEKIVGDIKIIKVRIEKERFLRACIVQTPIKNSDPVLIPDMAAPDPFINNNTPHQCQNCLNCSKGTSPVINNDNTPDPAPIINNNKK